VCRPRLSSVGIRSLTLVHALVGEVHVGDHQLLSEAVAVHAVGTFSQRFVHPRPLDTRRRTNSRHTGLVITLLHGRCSQTDCLCSGYDFDSKAVQLPSKGRYRHSDVTH